MNMIDRPFLFLHPNFHQKSFKFIISDTLLSNGYSIQFNFDSTLFHISTMRLKTILKNERKNRT